ncbi:NAD(P)-binding protein [Coccomyxa subellipsoidea C-169]|uniref:Flavanone 4-reductase n=1 Tax=Coccomyxa subellipsoidea (strain C-169) TaxID=574566 RepID=I0Z250_COCSC|nr:NAD(P)-binding protein [Coccomyxa subellipsoidea C-169]EIE24719.1 NAD(P)-binding protein [Coccomyxa subellipsoidea C-169]|eukprot:XP_005649263.1 NAD(P)-binding protein [Coccomyxa subellipsoidea C-169]
MAFTAVVTGATGFVATEICRQLLEKGYNVRGTVRSLASKEKYSHLQALGEALPGVLTLHEADLLAEGSFDDVVKGADFVFHTASPFIREVHDPQKDLVDPAVKGTRNVVQAAVKSKDTVKRIVVTSSFAAVVKSQKGPQNGSLFTEEDWNDESSLDDQPYRFSKTEAEKEAWAISKREGLDLVTINPTFVLGPVVSSRTDATSIILFKDFVENKGADIIPWQVDVRDIGRAHVLAVEVPTASGRYIVSHDSTLSTKYISEVLSERFPQYQFPSGEDAPAKQVLDNSKVQKELGLQLLPAKFTYIDMATTLIQKGIAKPVAK